METRNDGHEPPFETDNEERKSDRVDIPDAGSDDSESEREEKKVVKRRISLQFGNHFIPMPSLSDIALATHHEIVKMLITLENS